MKGKRRSEMAQKDLNKKNIGEIDRRNFLKNMGKYSTIAAFALSGSSLLVACGGGGGGGSKTTPPEDENNEPPGEENNANFSGAWEVSENWEAGCDFSAGSDSYTVTIEQNNETITGEDSYGYSYTGTMEGSSATLETSWEAKGHTIKVIWNLTKNEDDSLQVDASWIVDESCTMQVQVSLAEVTDGDNGDNPDDYSDWTNNYSDWNNNYSDWSNAWKHAYSDWSNAWGNWMQSW
jgi:hypothetical protein